MVTAATESERATLRCVGELAAAAAQRAAAGADAATLDLEAVIRDLIVPLMLLRDAYPADPVWDQASASFQLH